MSHRFRDRRQAGQILAERVAALDLIDPVVLGLPRGGVPVAYEVALRLGAELDVLVVRKLGVPWHPELGMGAVSEEDVVVVNRDIVRAAGVDGPALAAVERREQAEVAARAARFRPGRRPVALAGRSAVIVDDGLATGGTARAAVHTARARGAQQVVLAVPVAPADAVAELAREADAVVCLAEPADFGAVGAWYDDFRQTSDAEVVELLDRAAARHQELPGNRVTPPAGAGPG